MNDTDDLESPLVASSACPHCGYDKPHGHTVEQLAAYKRDREAADGYVSTLVKQPTKEGWYLCKRVSLFGSAGEHWQLDWQRKFMESMRSAHYADPDGIPEVCWWGNAHGTLGFHLRHGIGVPGLSGAETRRALPVNAELWRELP